MRWVVEHLVKRGRSQRTCSRKYCHGSIFIGVCTSSVRVCRLTREVLRRRTNSYYWHERVGRVAALQRKATIVLLGHGSVLRVVLYCDVLCMYNTEKKQSYKNVWNIHIFKINLETEKIIDRPTNKYVRAEGVRDAFQQLHVSATPYIFLLNIKHHKHHTQLGCYQIQSRERDA